MKYTNTFDGSDNYIEVEDWEGLIPENEPEFIYQAEEYYYQIEMELDDDDAFLALTVKKVGGGDDDDAHGSEWYEEMTDEDIKMILEYVQEECFE